MGHNDLRVPVLKRIAEQAMSDEDFRRAAAADLDVALKQWGYDLYPRELELVHKFRTTLAEAGIDLMLAKNMDLDSIFDDASGEDVERLLDGDSRKQPYRHPLWVTAEEGSRKDQVRRSRFFDQSRSDFLRMTANGHPFEACVPYRRSPASPSPGRM